MDSKNSFLAAGAKIAAKSEVKKPVLVEPSSTRMGDNGLPLTEEQDHAVDLAVTRKDLKIEAFAGAGKTSTLVSISQALRHKRGVYIAFNKSIAEEAKARFPSNVHCRTAHSLAYGAIGHTFKDRFSRLNGSVLAEHLKVKTGFMPSLTQSSSCNLVLDAITKFTQSADSKVDHSHLPWDVLMQVPDQDRREYMADRITNLANKAWEMMIDPNGTIPITHDVYLKLWVMSEPNLKADFILFDEAQDANPALLDLVTKQLSQQIYVGDRYQQIYSWRGATNAMQEIETPNSTYITQSFRFGHAVANVANAILNQHLGANVSVKGFDRIDSQLIAGVRPDAILFRTNGALLGEAMSRMGSQRVAITGGVTQLKSLILGAKELMAGNRTNQRELMLFDSWNDVVEFSESGTGKDLKLLVKIMTKQDPNFLLNSLSEIEKNNESSAEIVLSTAHKAKGREWDNVKLGSDFKMPPKEGEENSADNSDNSGGYRPEESNLLYVAATRAKLNLDISECEAALDAIEMDSLANGNDYYFGEQERESVGPR